MKFVTIPVFLFLCALAVQLPAQKAAPPEPMSPVDIFARLDAGRGDELQHEGIEHVYAVLKAERPYPKKPALLGKHFIPFTDDMGRETTLFLNVPEKPTGVLVLLHGLGADARQVSGAFADAVVERENLIILAPSAQKELPGKENSDFSLLNRIQPHWWSYRSDAFVLSALRDLARRVRFNRDRVYISGHSMGGFGTWNIGLRFADRFAAAAPLSGGISRREYLGSSPHRLHHNLLDNAYHLPLFFAHGSEDPMVPVRFERNLHEGLVERGIEHTYIEQKGLGHGLDFGGEDGLMQRMETWFDGRLREPHPERVHHTVIDNLPSRSFWLRIDEIWASRGRVQAQVMKDNKILVRTSGVTRMTLFLDEELVDPEKPIEVVVNGKQVFEGQVEPSLAAILDSWKGYEDPAFVCRRRLMIDVP